MKARVCALVVLMVLVVLAHACALFDPQTGALRDAGALLDARTSSDPYAPKPEAGAPDLRCSDDAGPELCAQCETKNCCATRFACYDDPGCLDADEDFDRCVDDAHNESASVACWDKFAKSSALASARIACERDHCATECAVP
jgi:hypothetical protein